MDETHVVTCFLRNGGNVLLLGRSGGVGSYAGQWGGVAGHVAPASADDTSGESGDPDAAARREIAEETALDDAVTLVRRGEPFPVEDTTLETRWMVHPYLFDAASRDVTPNYETTTYTWVPPTEILRRETVPELWTSYDRVRPTVDTVADDREHGSAYVSLRALDVLRDEAALARERGTGDWSTLAATARELRDARPSMTVVTNRVNRVMATAVTEQTATAVEEAAGETIRDALAADEMAAETAAERIEGQRVVTLSRSGTVATALAIADPVEVLVATSRPGGEGTGVAERLAADDTDVTLAPDAALAWELADGSDDAVLVGADTVLSDGCVVNKVGTRALALASAREDVPLYVVTASDKISPADEPRLEATDTTGYNHVEIFSTPGCRNPPRSYSRQYDPATVYDGEADITVTAPLFDVTPPDLITGVVTEDGLLDPEAVAAVANAHRDRADWER